MVEGACQRRHVVRGSVWLPAVQGNLAFSDLPECLEINPRGLARSETSSQ